MDRFSVNIKKSDRLRAAPYRKRCRIIVVVFQALLVSAMCAWSQIEQWERNDGSSFEARLVTITVGDAIFKTADGEVFRTPLVELSEESRVRAELAQAPTLDIDLIQDIDAKVFRAGTRETTQRPPERYVKYGMRIRQTSAGPYNYPLTAEMFVIGQQRLGGTMILFDRQTATFTLTRENRRTYEFRSERIVKMRNDLHEWGWMMGETYFGFIVVVKDMLGNVVAVRSTHSFLEENLDNLRERYAGNYLDKNLNRTYPTRPPQSAFN